MEVRKPSYADIESALVRIRDGVHRTPVLTATSIDGIVGGRLFFKCENMQRVGAFKIRGATNAVRQLSDEARRKGVATHSSGNHAQAVALAAGAMDVPAYIVMPENSPAVKVDAVRGYGAAITFCEATQAAREVTLERVVAETGAAFVHPYDDDRVIAGQGTAAFEFLDEVERRGEELDLLVGPVGGGGLMSGTAICARHRTPGIRLYGAEPAGADDGARSIETGVLQGNDTVDTIADGLRTNLSERTFAILRAHLDGIWTVDDDEIVAAMRLLYERMKVVVEPSAAVPLAAVVRHRAALAGKRIGIILSGGNVDLTALFSTYEGKR